MSTMTGKILGKYQLGERLGRGGMAEVYRATHPRLGRDVAIKILHPHLIEGAGLLARFEREGQAIARLRHPHIVQIYDFDVEDETVYMVMEFLDGGSLKARLLELQARGEYLPLTGVARLVDEIGQALDFAHGRAILHRDVKPANVLLDREGKAYLTDFGIVRILGESQFTATGSLVGTPAYMSPEQGKGEPLTPASDLYALGVVLYELLTNRVPFDADTPLAIVHKHVHEPVPALESLRPDLPAGVAQVVERALAKAPQDRYPSAAALLRDLRDSLQQVVLPQGATAATPHMPVQPAQAEVGEGTTADFMPTVALEEPSEADYKPTVAVEPEPAEKASTTPPPPAEIPSVLARQESLPPRRIARSKWVLWAGAVIVLATAAIGIARSGVLGSGGAEACGGVQACWDLALEALAVQQAEPAIAYLDEALSRVGETEHALYAELWCLRGQADQSLGRVPDAAADFTTCIEWSEGEPGLADLRASAEAALRELGGGEVVCDAPEGCGALAEGLIGEGRFEEAVAALDQGIAKVPEDQHPPNARLWCLHGEAMARMQLTAEAVRSYENCIGWTEGEPDLEALRQEAAGKIEQLSGG